MGTLVCDGGNSTIGTHSVCDDGKSKMGTHIVTEAMIVVLRLRLQSLFGARRQPSAPVIEKYSNTP